jgi:mono/diheme cytochrome c family protein
MNRLFVALTITVLAVAPGCGKKDKDKKGPSAKTQPTAPTPPPVKPDPPKPDPEEAKAELVKKGAYVANVTGCVLCHTGVGPQGPDLANPFAGGLEVTEEMPGGMKFDWRSPNITPDPDTGIGKWTDEQIIAAVREGVRADGSRLSPMMPYMMYNAMSDDDAKALVAFLRAQKPVARKVERIPLPKAFEAMPPTPKAAGTAWPAEKRGEYLATLMHCAMCHTPMGPQGPDMKRAFAGGNPMKIPPQFKAVGTGTNFSANITSDPETGIGKWTEQQVADAIKSMKRPDPKRPIIGFPMFLYQTTWSQLTDDDVMAVAKYIKGIAPVVNKVPGSTFKPGPMMEMMMKGGQSGHDGPPPGGGPAPTPTPADVPPPK